MPDCPRNGSASRMLGGALLAVALLPVPAGAALLPTPAAAAPGPAPAAAAPATATAEPGPVAVPAELAVAQPHHQLTPLGATEAWRHSTGAGVTVAVLDSGVDAAHPDLDGRVLAGRDYVDGETDGRVDVVGHGTTVASLIAGGGDEVIGLAPDAEILPVRVLDAENRYQRASTVAEGVVWAVEHGAQVINLSLGGDRYSPALGEALSFAMANDVVVVACTGNATEEPDAQVWYPAREPGVVAVAGLTWSDGSPTGWSRSLTGPETVLAAPSVVTGSAAGGGRRAVQGTSFSSALVAATAALVRSRWPDLPAGDVVNRLVATAADLGEPGRDLVYGFGVVDPVAALTETVSPVPVNPLDTTPDEGSAGLGTAPSQPPPERAAPEPATPKPTIAAVEPLPGQPAGAAADDPMPPGRSRSPVTVLVWALLAGLCASLVLAVTFRLRRAR